MSEPRTVFDTVVVGAGPGGYFAAIRLAQRGQKVAVIEREDVGGVCLNWGCIPSKALISASERYAQAKNSTQMGVHVEAARFDFAEAQAFARDVVHHHVSGVEGLLKSAGVELVRGEATVLADRRVRVLSGSTSSPSERLLEASSLLIATGATPTAPPGAEPDGLTVLSAKEAVRLERLPEHLIVLGGGVIGLELGSMFLHAGARVTVVEAAEQLLGRTDADLVRIVERSLVRGGMTIHKGARLPAVERGVERGDESPEPGVRLRITSSGSEHTLVGSHLLVSTGFSPNTRGLFASELNVELDERGHIRVDGSGRSNVPGIFAIGDVTGGPYLAHRAYKQAEVAAEAILGKRTVMDHRALPSAIFTSPEIAVSGLSETEAQARGVPYELARFPFAALGRAGTIGGSDGFVKMLHHQGRILGFGLVGPHVSELLGEIGMALETGATVEDLALTIHPHPTFSEALREVAEVALGQPIHVQARKRA